jgi:hypothetical protein
LSTPGATARNGLVYIWRESDAYLIVSQRRLPLFDPTWHAIFAP